MNLDIKVYTFLNYESDFQKYVNKCLEYHKILNDDNLKKNYFPEQLKIEEWLAISVFLNEKDELFGFSSVAHRDCFYNGVRILNRFVKHPHFRFINSKMELSLETQMMVNQQIQISKSLNFNFAFVSRDSKKNPMKHYFKNIDTFWIHETKKYRVCKGDKTCCQIVSWMPLKENANLELDKCCVNN